MVLCAVITVYGALFCVQGADQVEDLQRIPVLRSLNKLTPTVSQWAK